MFVCCWLFVVGCSCLFDAWCSLFVVCCGLSLFLMVAFVVVAMASLLLLLPSLYCCCHCCPYLVLVCCCCCSCILLSLSLVLVLVLVVFVDGGGIGTPASEDVSNWNVCYIKTSWCGPGVWKKWMETAQHELDGLLAWCPIKRKRLKAHNWMHFANKHVCQETKIPLHNPHTSYFLVKTSVIQGDNILVEYPKSWEAATHAVQTATDRCFWTP